MNIGQSTDNSNKDNHDTVSTETSLYSIHKLLPASNRDYKTKLAQWNKTAYKCIKKRQIQATEALSTEEPKLNSTKENCQFSSCSKEMNPTDDGLNSSKIDATKKEASACYEIPPLKDNCHTLTNYCQLAI